MTAKEQKKAAADFAAKWVGKGYEKGECQKFWRGLLHDVFEIADLDWTEINPTIFGAVFKVSVEMR